MKFSIITPTTGNPKLEKLLLYINTQTKSNDMIIEHLIVIDGPQYYEYAMQIINKIKPVNERFVFSLPFNTGNSGFLGHKIYASISQLVNGDWIIFADEDNYFENNHNKQKNSS